MLDTLLFACIALPCLLAVLIYFTKCECGRHILVIAGVGLLIVAALALASKGNFIYVPGSWVSGLILILDYALLGLILYLAFKIKRLLIVWLAIAQVVGLTYLEFFQLHQANSLSVPLSFAADTLSLVMVLIVSVVGGIICIYGLGYMKVHEEHLHLKKTKQPMFFMLMLLFLGAMNGLVLSGSLLWVYFFWEITTLCSFLLIGHDDTEEARNNAARALWMNMLGGVAFVFGMMLLQKSAGTLDIQTIIIERNLLLNKGLVFLLPLGFLCFAGFTKAAQLPFQSWLCGAMVAPTPVSALLHSSTMVKAGVYLILRFAPAFEGTFFSGVLAIAGGFTFIVTSALAVGQSNGKKVLAYSTIANLGLIIACAGINTAAAITAAMIILIFHAVSKALLFLCIGSIEQQIGSRNIESMRSLYMLMPRTTIIMVIGILTMFLPPFGMLLGKWIAIESALFTVLGMPLLVVMLALGSALTVLFWARWAGIMLGATSPGLKVEPEAQEKTIKYSLFALVIGAVLLSLGSPCVFTTGIAPMLGLYPVDTAFSVVSGTFENPFGIFTVYTLFVLLAVAVILAFRFMRKAGDKGAALPYMSGIQKVENNEVGFIGPMNTFVMPTAANYYLEAIFNEDKLSRTVNIVAIVILVIMLGGVL